MLIVTYCGENCLVGEGKWVAMKKINQASPNQYTHKYMHKYTQTTN